MKNLILILMFFAFNLFPAQQGDAPMGNTNLGVRPQLAEDEAEHPAKRQKLESKEEKAEKVEAQKPEADEKEKKEKAENINIKVVKSPTMKQKTIDINEPEPIDGRTFKEIIEERVQLGKDKEYILARVIPKDDPQDKTRSFYDAHQLNLNLFPRYTALLPYVNDHDNALFRLYAIDVGFSENVDPLTNERLENLDPLTRSKIERVEYYKIRDINQSEFEYIGNNKDLFSNLGLLFLFYKNFFGSNLFLSLIENYVKNHPEAAKKAFENIINRDIMQDMVQVANYGLGHFYLNLNDTSNALKYFRGAIDKKHDPSFRLRAAIELGDLYFKQNKFNESLYVYNFVKQLLLETKGWSARAIFDLINPKLAFIYDFYFKDYKKAKEIYDDILNSTQAIPKVKAQANLRLGQMYHYGQGVEKDLQKAKEYYNFAFNQNENIKVKNQAQKELDALNNVNQQAAIS